MTKKRFKKVLGLIEDSDGGLLDLTEIEEMMNTLNDENERLKAQLYCDDEEGICNHCKHHYLVKDDEVELGYYKSRCKKRHYECARVSLKHCEDFEKR